MGIFRLIQMKSLTLVIACLLLVVQGNLFLDETDLHHAAKHWAKHHHRKITKKQWHAIAKAWKKHSCHKAKAFKMVNGKLHKHDRKMGVYCRKWVRLTVWNKCRAHHLSAAHKKKHGN